MNLMSSTLDNIIREVSNYITDYEIDKGEESTKGVIDYYIECLIETRLEDKDLTEKECEVLSNYYYGVICNSEELETILYLPKYKLILYPYIYKYKELKQYLDKNNIKYKTSLDLTK